jgi:hypothetical protein
MNCQSGCGRRGDYSMSTEVVVAIIGFITGIVGLIAAIIGRRKENIHRKEIVHRFEHVETDERQGRPPSFFSGEVRGSRVLLGLIIVPLLIIGVFLILRLILWLN